MAMSDAHERYELDEKPQEIEAISTALPAAPTSTGIGLDVGDGGFDRGKNVDRSKNALNHSALVEELPAQDPVSMPQAASDPSAPADETKLDRRALLLLLLQHFSK